jgi:hypothetical protein
MKTVRTTIQILYLFALAAGLLTLPGIVSADWSVTPPPTGSPADDCPCRKFTTNFMTGRCGGWSDNGTNPYFVLKPGFTAVFEGKEGKVLIHVTITVTNNTQLIDGVATRVVEEEELQNGVLAERSTNYFAICERTNSVFYFGEDVDMYDKTGTTVVSHEGAWRAGVNGTNPGIVMSGVILNGGRYYQEIAPGVAMDRAEIINTNFTVTTPAGTFTKCLQTSETTPLEPGAVETKFYAPGIGLVKDDTLSLISYHY